MSLDPRFPTHAQEIPSAIVAHLAKQVEVPPVAFAAYDWQSRTSTYHRQQIRTALGFRELSGADTQALTVWLQDTVLPTERDSGRLAAAIYQRCRELRIEPPTPERVARLVGSAAYQYEEQFCQAVAQRLSPEVQARLDALLLASVTLAAIDPSLVLMQWPLAGVIVLLAPDLLRIV